jgi:hypothetical protein
MPPSAPGPDLTNPKDLIGQTKVDLSLLPAAGIIHGSHAFMDGAEKYGPYNWRAKQVRARVYISAAQRHLLDYLDGEDAAADSECFHLGHAIACCAIILDAFETGNLIDDRPLPGKAAQILERLNGILKRRAESKRDHLAEALADTERGDIRDDINQEKAEAAHREWVSNVRAGRKA